MKKIGEFVKRMIGNEYLLIPVGQTAQGFNGMILLSGVGGFIWEHIEEVNSFGELVDLVTEEYEIDRETASDDAREFLLQMLGAGLIRPSNRTW